MLCGVVTACNNYGRRTVRCDDVMCYVVVWQHVMGMVCVLFAVLSTILSHTRQYTHHT